MILFHSEMSFAEKLFTANSLNTSVSFIAVKVTKFMSFWLVFCSLTFFGLIRMRVYVCVLLNNIIMLLFFTCNYFLFYFTNYT
ncbi:unnamed protein product [Tenebrio molitor]|nr:unnamed protein product [Tenebrio molitor]